MKQTLILVAVVLLLAVAIVTPSPAAGTVESREYTVTVAITQTQDGKEKTLATPTLILKDSEAGSFLSGGMVTNKDLDQSAEFGTSAKITVRQKAADRLLVSVDVSGSNLSDDHDGDYTVHKCGTQCVKTIKPGDSIYVDMGEGRQAKVAVLPIGK